MRCAYRVITLLMVLSLFAGCKQIPLIVEPGSLDDRTNPDAPKTIVSNEIESFHCEYRYDIPGASLWCEFDAKLDGETVSVTVRGIDDYHMSDFSEERTEPLSFLTDLQNLVIEGSFSSLNGTYRHTNCLPEQLGASITVEYASEERIYAYNNSSSFFSSASEEALFELFVPSFSVAE